MNLTKQDLHNIRQIIGEEIELRVSPRFDGLENKLRSEIAASELRTIKYVDTRFDDLVEQIDRLDKKVVLL